MIKSIAVFCGSSAGNTSLFTDAAKDLGTLLAKEGVQLIYGGAKVGLMGTVADAVLENGGRVIGVLPNFLGGKEIAHAGLDELIMVDSMHERKMKMHELSDGVIALPGGYGTLEELFEFITWGQLGLHGKPTGILNVDGFYDTLLLLMDQMVDKGFLKLNNREMLLDDSDGVLLLQKMRSYIAPETPKWINSAST